MSDLSAPSARRFKAAADALGLAVSVLEMSQPTRTAEEAATACGCGVGQIVKSLVFEGANSGSPYLLLVSGATRVDQAGVAAAIGESLNRPDAAKVRAWTGYAIGGIPPFGHETAMPSFIDEDLLGYPLVWAAAGTPMAVFSVDPNALATAIGARAMRVG